MTKKDYQALAGALHMTLGHSSTTQWAADVDSIMRALTADNPKFDHERFVVACELGNEIRVAE